VYDSSSTACVREAVAPWPVWEEKEGAGEKGRASEGCALVGN
jgi:hypothetical protein